MAASPFFPNRAHAARILVLCCAGWAFSFPAMKALQLLGERDAPGNGSVFFAAAGVVLRFGVAGLVLAAVLGRRLRGVTRREFKQGAGLGLFGGVGMLLQMDGMAYTSASTSAFLTQAYCVWLPFWFAVSHRRWPPLAVLASSALVLFGGAVLAGVEWGHLHLGRGEWETLAGSVIFTGQILWLDRREFRGNDVLRFTFVMFAVMTLTLLPVALLTGRQPADMLRAFASPTALGLFALLIGPCTLGAFLLANRWQPEIPATEAGLLYSTEPVFTSLVVLFLPALISRWSGIHYPNEHLTWNLVIGGGLVLAANAWLQLRERRNQADVEAPGTQAAVANEAPAPPPQ